MEKNELEYLAVVEIESEGDIPEGMIIWNVSAQIYAVVETPLSKLPKIFKTFENWYSQSGYR